MNLLKLIIFKSLLVMIVFYAAGCSCSSEQVKCLPCDAPPQGQSGACVYKACLDGAFLCYSTAANLAVQVENASSDEQWGSEPCFKAKSAAGVQHITNLRKNYNSAIAVEFKEKMKKEFDTEDSESFFGGGLNAQTMQSRSDKFWEKYDLEVISSDQAMEFCKKIAGNEENKLGTARQEGFSELGDNKQAVQDIINALGQISHPQDATCPSAPFAGSSPEVANPAITAAAVDDFAAASQLLGGKAFQNIPKTTRASNFARGDTGSLGATAGTKSLSPSAKPVESKLDLKKEGSSLASAISPNSSSGKRSASSDSSGNSGQELSNGDHSSAGATAQNNADSIKKPSLNGGADEQGFSSTSGKTGSTVNNSANRFLAGNGFDSNNNPEAGAASNTSFHQVDLNGSSGASVSIDDYLKKNQWNSLFEIVNKRSEKFSGELQEETQRAEFKSLLKQ